MGIQDVLTKYAQSEQVKLLVKAIQGKNPKIQLKGLIGASDAIVAAAAYTVQERPFIFILPTHEEASYFLSDLESILDKQILFFPASFRKAYEFTQTDASHVLQRAETLSALNHISELPKIVVTYPEAIAEKVINREDLEKNTLAITQNTKLSIDFINEFLYEYDFERVDFVYEPGQFAIRGGIVDIFSFSNDLPYRVEFFGDEIESIRTFDMETQLSVNKIHTVTIVPNVQAKFLSNNHISLLEYVDRDAVIWIKDVQFTLDIMKDGYKKASEFWKALPEKDILVHADWVDPRVTFTTDRGFGELMFDFPNVEFGKHFYYKAEETLKFDIHPQPSFNKDFTLLIHNFKENVKHGIENLIFSDSTKQVERIYSILEDIDKSVTFTPIHKGLREGFRDDETKLACYTDHQIFDRYYKYKRKKGYERSQAITLKELRDLKPGDYITHIDHGVGKYAGLEKVEVNGKTQEMIRLVYADNDLLYVNINSLNRISKYSGKEGTVPKMNKLGTDAWEKLKKTTKRKVKDIARDLIKLYAKRKSQTGNAFSPDTYLQNELEASFLYEDTPDQEKATADVKRDMESPHPMDRLVCGDVGFGKTEVAIRAAFKAATDNKQVAVLVPTTILALQHFRTFSERLKEFPVTIDYINRFKSTKQIKDTLARLAEGKIDIIIGTHRLVSKDVKFKDLGLMIIDEEQKFGVAVKEKLKVMRANVDSLTLTATPIPRTLHFSLMGARDLSIISTPPPNRQPVQTELHVFNETLIQEAVAFELDRNGQVFFIHNRVADLKQLGGMIQKLVPGARVGIAHGQLEGDALEDVMLKFINHEFDVLVATTIIEAGLDIPNANTIIINHAHMFGLSDLHQMRGRVGRSNKKAFCYLLSPPLSTLTNEAYKRLSALEEFSELGSGFNVAMRDLDIRGSGNLLGAEQSGFIAEIGFEMYNKILDEAVQELKDDEFSELFAEDKNRKYVTFTQIDTDLEVMIPDAYVTNIGERYNLYNEIAKLENETQLIAFQKELEDRFGPVPQPVFELFNTLRLQWYGKEIGFEKISFKKNTLKGYFVSNPKSSYYESDQFGKVLAFVQAHPAISNMKEVKGQLRLAISNVNNITYALHLLKEMSN
ncbi:transcription-repair coupling factor [Sphingobacterium psychroaquaticum]|uniref:Transcription-repair-coupling factor n=1 Tax=Sphingobacterium psychroaquaticum TaxID=561061 RepID=A0A1X7L1T0_9SPHI|nr:transcription-repair coupling factor [Sphingobacterium psychroaquaticum]QBQ39811.1 transcription-repair coupling factor [Sphingobacterium psychroaquaticum]SMG47454.1 transcription-repair coupling factor (superfamily II helicase) [Sphingobacterium psychroaquaticum]